ncbi:hypothetical protein KIN20_011963 [Parelaphostrongylus tenuis]|uniref:Uncharacterized protein n=1 Tax=Parelaphostrongylus tenuis TaxID=148309 RepID=A0AAD5QMU2_PARTN|nr:hypothetical protein KIN20_011963 [Parelaphostrongylus tenuis]
MDSLLSSFFFLSIMFSTADQTAAQRVIVTSPQQQQQLQAVPPQQPYYPRYGSAYYGSYGGGYYRSYLPYYRGYPVWTGPSGYAANPGEFGVYNPRSIADYLTTRRPYGILRTIFGGDDEDTNALLEATDDLITELELQRRG